MSVLYIFIFSALVVLTLGQSNVPVISNYTALKDRYLSESLPKDYNLGKIIAYDPDGKGVSYYIDGDGGEYFAIGTATGEVTLKKLLDYETTSEIKLNIRVVDGDSQTTVVEGKVFVNDANDNAPTFDNTAIFRNLSEATPVGFSVAPINVNDLDTNNKILTVRCIGATPALNDACNTFGLNMTRDSNKFWNGFLILLKPLDYETRISYAVQLQTFDGLFYVTNEVHIEIIDINDTPPRWISADPKDINEELPINTPVQTVSAIDGDLTSKHEIYYEIISASKDTFGINTSTGEIYVKKRIDYDDDSYQKGIPYDVTILAREVIQRNSSYTLLGNDSSNTATVNIKITVLDIDDNTPTFSQPSYTAEVNENIIAGANVPRLEMVIRDIDSGNYNSFRLVTLNYTEIFGIIPDEDSSYSTASLYIKSSGVIDYEKQKTYIIRVEAQENKAFPPRTGTATVTINVKDVNDITPSFDKLAYNTTVSETASVGTNVITIVATDPEEGNFGTAGIRYKLYGNIPQHFEIDAITGVVKVAPCNGIPGVGPDCIDYEQKKIYSLTVSATDVLGNAPDSLTRTVQLIINVLDENDNVPRLESSYVRYMYEGQTVTINPLIINATDPDTVGGPVTYTIENDRSGLWSAPALTDTTKHSYTNITAKRPIFYNDAPDVQNGAFNFTVVAADQKYRAYAQVTIYVIDINNNDPLFSRAVYEQSIYENTKGDFFVIQVTATDGDSYTTGNGLVNFYIQSGSLGKFTVKNVTRNNVTNVFTADIYTSSDAVFNFDTQNLYDMQLLAIDSGTPSSRFGNTTLRVNILDVNNRDPRINPLSQSVTVSEHEAIGTTVYRILADDPDANSSLRYHLTPERAIDGTGVDATSTLYDFRKMFRINDRTGDIIVNGTLDRQSVSRITYSVGVDDVSANPVQHGNGSFLIYILEYNDQSPVFDLPLYEIDIDEEQNINAFVQNLNCKDEDDKIAGYDLTQDNPRFPAYFSLIPGSGAMIVANRIDFDDASQGVETIELTASCTDTGQPQLSNKTKVVVHIRNINDNTPTFQQGAYHKYLPEGTYSGPLNLIVSATDLDKGDYGVIRYEINDNSTSFTINSTTGEIYFKPNSTFDRETTAFVSFQVTATDSPLNPNVSRSSVVSVYVDITDVNDNCPIFSNPSYYGYVPESAGPNTNVVDLQVNDTDEGANGLVSFQIKANSFSPPGAESLFDISSFGRIFVTNSLRTKSGRYTFNVTATDHGTPQSCSTEVPVTVEIKVSLNDAPSWVKPPNRDFVIYVLESQYDGMLVYGAKAVDNNTGPNGIVDYFFVVKNDLVSNTPEFRINQVTGVIRAEIVYDRETVDRYVLTLMAKDRGVPSASSETTLTVMILDVNDNDPKFPLKNGVVTPLVLPDSSITIGENVNIPIGGLRLGACIATDSDSNTTNNKIYYKILSDQASILDYIRVNNKTCEVYLIKKPDFEASPELHFDIYAYNEDNNDRVVRNKREVDASILPVVIKIRDDNDNPPVFTQSQYYECVSDEAPYKETILEVSATDKDTGSKLLYALSGTDVFTIDSHLGIISNVISFQYSSNVQPKYTFKAIATDEVYNSTADVTIVVVSTSNLVNLKINRPLQDIEPFKQQIARSIQTSNPNNIQFACILDMRNHVEDDGTLNPQASDVVVGAVNPATGQLYSAPDLVSLIQDDRNQAKSVYNAIYVTDVKADEKKDSFSLKEDAVLAVLIITILLIFLAIVLFIIACLCIRRSKKKKTKMYKKWTPVLTPHPVESSVNPVYKDVVVPDEAIYTLPKKKPINTDHSYLIVDQPAVVEPSYSPPPEPVRAYLTSEPTPYIETELEPVPTHFHELPPQHQPFEPEFDAIVTEVDDDFPPPVSGGEIDTEIRDSPLSSSSSSPASSRKSEQD